MLKIAGNTYQAYLINKLTTDDIHVIDVIYHPRWPFQVYLRCALDNLFNAVIKVILRRGGTLKTYQILNHNYGLLLYFIFREGRRYLKNTIFLLIGSFSDNIATTFIMINSCPIMTI